MHRRLSAALLALGLLAPACAPDRDQPDPGECSPAMASTAVRLQLFDTEGFPIAGTRVSFTVDGGDEQDAVCAEDDDCTEWVTGYDDVAGQYTLAIELEQPLPEDPSCFQWAWQTLTVDVEEGICTLATEEIPVTLDVGIVCEELDGSEDPAPEEEDDG